ncbi:MAG: hypothetical protein K8H84_02180 [Sulfuricella denitrificans]|nr:hypothetical protein [Sulfuricella denitrificans]
MMDFDLPVILADAPQPEFGDASMCRKWLKTLPLTNIHGLHGELRQQLELLSHFALPALERLKILEQLRETVSYLAGELGKKYQNRPLPFSSLEQTAWNNEQAMWFVFGNIYLQCLQAAQKGDTEVSPFIALISQRVISSINSRILGFAHAYRTVPAGLWRQLHDLYRYAEAKAVAAKRIKDALSHDDGTNSCEASYAKVLLLGLADPQQLTSRQILQLDRWLDRWTSRVKISRNQPPTPSLPLVSVDLAGEGGAVIFTGQIMSERRFVDTERLALSLRKRIKFLSTGGNPAEVGLGDECIQPACEVLLGSLYKRWCEVPLERSSPRGRSGNSVQLCFAFPAIYFFLSDASPFKQPGETLDIAPEILEDMRMFGRVTQRTEKLLFSRLGFNLENWNSLDQSAGGFRLSRSGAGERISQNQLIAVRSSDNLPFNLAVVRWLMVGNEAGDLSIGTRVLPGLPTVLAARPLTLNPSDMGLFVPAFRLSAVPEQHEPASLVLPIGWFQPGKRLQIYSSQTETYKLITLLEKGSNFERVTFVSEPMY